MQNEMQSKKKNKIERILFQTLCYIALELENKQKYQIELTFLPNFIGHSLCVHSFYTPILFDPI